MSLDKVIRRVFYDDAETRGYLRFKFVVCKVLQREAYLVSSLSRNVVDVHLMEQGLHDRPDELRKQLQEAISSENEFGPNYDAVLLGYGLCSNGIVGLKPDTKLIVPRGHDCITLLLGSRERYQHYFDAYKGTYWYSPGWIETNVQPGEERYEKSKKFYEEKYGPDNAEYLLETDQSWIREYKNAVYVYWPGLDKERYRDYTRKCSEFLNWKYHEVQGDPGLMQDMVDGKWDERFLTVNPGFEIEEDLTSEKLIRTCSCKNCNQ